MILARVAVNPVTPAIGRVVCLRQGIISMNDCAENLCSRQPNRANARHAVLDSCAWRRASDSFVLVECVVRVMREDATNFAVSVKFHHLRRQQAVNAAVFQNAAPHAGIKSNEFESERWKCFQPAREIISQWDEGSSRAKALGL